MGRGRVSYSCVPREPGRFGHVVRCAGSKDRDQLFSASVYAFVVGSEFKLNKEFGYTV